VANKILPQIRETKAKQETLGMNSEMELEMQQMQQLY
jgi:hypothetical protein